MTQIRITKEFKIEMAHALLGYDGPCQNIHGHSYQLFVTVIGNPLVDKDSPKKGMVLDFNILKEIVRKNVINKFDHSLVLNAAVIKEKYNKFDEINELFNNLILVNYQPTSENLILEFVQIIKEKLPPNIKLHNLKLRETVTSFVEWFAEDNQ